MIRVRHQKHRIHGPRATDRRGVEWWIGLFVAGVLSVAAAETPAESARSTGPMPGHTNGPSAETNRLGAPPADEKASLPQAVAATTADTPRLWTVDGKQAEGGFGMCIAGVGDVNKDGFADVLVSAPFYDDKAGRVFVYYGSKAGSPRTPSWESRGDHPGACHGITATGAGDVNGDGYADVIVIAGDSPEGRPPGVSTVYVYHGSPTGLGTNAGWHARDGRFGHRGPPQDDRASVELGPDSAPDLYYGYSQLSAGSAGDVNGDGFGDVYVVWVRPPGASMRARGTLVFHGSAAGIEQRPAWRVEGADVQVEQQFGTHVAAAGDVNGDGFGDLLVGAPEANGLYPHGGRVFLYLGSAQGLDSRPAWEATYDLPTGPAAGEAGDQLFGSALGSAGDVNKDGFADVMIGAPWADHYDLNEGMVFAFHGSPNGLRRRPDCRIESNRPFATLGYALAGVGDLNGDGYADVAIGAPEAARGIHSQGAVAVFHGSPRGLIRRPVWTAEGDSASLRFGNRVAGAGDVDGDGCRDLLVCASGEIPYKQKVGRVYLFYGSPRGLEGSSGWSMRKPGLTRLTEGFQDLPPRWRWCLGIAALGALVVGAYLVGRAFERHRRRVLEKERSATLEVERGRIARDLHDDLGARISQLQRMTALTTEAGARDGVDAERLAATARELSLSLEQIIWAVEPEQDTLENLVVFLGQYADQYFAGTGMRCRRDLPIEFPSLSLRPGWRKHVFLAVKEAFNNVAKHSQASEVWLRVRWENERLRIIVEDNGHGLEGMAVEAPGNSGLKNMRERIGGLGGTVECGRSSQGGLALRFEIPLPREQ